MYGLDAFKTFHCPDSVHPLVFAQMCSFYHQGKISAQTLANNSNSFLANTSSVNASTLGTSSEAKKKDPSAGLDTVLCQIWVGNAQEAICIPANSVKVLQGKTSKVTCKISCMIEPRASNNLPMVLVVNRTMVTPAKSKKSQ